MQAWCFSGEELYPAIFTNFDFNSFTELNGKIYGCKDGKIYVLEGADDAGTPIEPGIRVNLGELGTRHLKRIYYIFFGLTGTPLLKVITDNGEQIYEVNNKKARIAKGLCGVNWEMILSQIDTLEFIEVEPVILQR